MANMTFGVNLLPNNTGGQKTLGNSNQRWNVWINQINGNTPITSDSLVSTTQLTNAATAATETANRVYPVALDANGKLAVNVPWTEATTSVSYSTTPASVNVSTTGATGSIVLGEAATKQVDSTVTSSSTNLPTSAAVATYVQQNTGSADWADIIDSSVDTTDVDYTEGSEYLYNHIRASDTDTIIGNNVTVSYNGDIAASNVTASQVNVKGTGAIWQWIPTSTGLELVCAPTT